MQTTSDEIRRQASELDKLAKRLRREEFQALKDKGWTLEEIGQAQNPPISKQRVSKILEGKEG